MCVNNEGEGVGKLTLAQQNRWYLSLGWGPQLF